MLQWKKQPLPSISWHSQQSLFQDISRPDKRTSAGLAGTYTEEVKKGLKIANLPEIDVPNDVDSAAIFQVAPQPSLQTTYESSTIQKPTPQSSDENQSVCPKARHPSISTASTTSELSHIQAHETAISTMDTEATTQEEELEINSSTRTIRIQRTKKAKASNKNPLRRNTSRPRGPRASSVCTRSKKVP